MNNANMFYRANALVKTKSRISLQAGDNSVVDNKQLPKMPQSSRVIIDEEVYKTMKMIGDISNTQRKEIPFLLFGHSEGQTVFFDDIEADVSDSSGRAEAVFSSYLVNKLKNFCLSAKKSENKIISHGHTHYAADNHGYYLNYSLADIDAYIKLRDTNELIKNNVDVSGCLLTGGNYNFVFYDGNDTYRFDDVFIKSKTDGRLMRLPAFGNIDVQQSRNLQYGGR